jgi:hypothetical protein
MQLIIVVFGISGINKSIDLMVKYFPAAKNQNLLSMLKIYAIISLVIAFIFLNDVSLEIFDLAQ